MLGTHLAGDLVTFRLEYPGLYGFASVTKDILRPSIGGARFGKRAG